MTESAYLAWIRSALRSKSLRWKPRNEALKLARRAYKGSNKAQKWEYFCSLCREWFIAKQVVVDHYPIEAGSILSIEDVGAFANNLFCETENLRVLCKPCHDVHTLSSKSGMSFQEAAIAKKAIAFMKDNSKEKVVAYCKELGYDSVSLSNAEKRRKCLIEIFSREIDCA